MTDNGRSGGRLQTAAQPADGLGSAATGASLDDPRVHQAMEDYLQLLQTEQRPNRQAFQARYPDLAEALAGCLQGLDFVHAAGAELSHPAVGGADAAGGVAAADAVEPVESLGDFRIVREIGRGGMGVVYEAVQLSLGRRVALKVLPFAAALDARQLQRFQHEAQAAALLHHTNIVPVFAVGSERGVYFYAMQFIEGQDLATVLRHLRQRAAHDPAGRDKPAGPAADPLTVPYVPFPPAVPVSPLAETVVPAVAGIATEQSWQSASYLRGVARLGIQAAEALEHAHQQGVVHRDIKPANLLLDVRQNLWITDFGLAQLRGDSRLTMSGDVLGTLRYMSPEQALAKRVVIDQRTDVYSLGVTLYELLTLQPAFGGEDRQEILRQIAFEEPRPIRRISKTVPRELETIVHKALEKNPADRFATAQELADDLRRFLEDRPIQARRPSLRQVAAKWVRRHKAVVWAATVVLLMAALLGGSAGLWWAQKRAGAEGEARESLREADRLRQEEKWSEALGAARRAKGALTGVGANTALRQQVEELAKDLEMVCRLEEARLRGAAVKDAQFDGEASNAAYAEAFQWYGLDVDRLDPREAAERIRSRSIRLQLAVVLDHWAYLRQRLKLGEWGPLVAISRAADPDPWRDRLRDALAGTNSKALEELTASASSDELPPPTAVLLAKLTQGTLAAERALLILRQVQQRHPADFWVNHEMGAGLSKLEPPRLDEAIRYYTAAVALRPQSPGAHLNLGTALDAKGQRDEAMAEYREAIRLKNDYAEAHSNLGAALYGKGQVDEAIAEFREAIRLKKDDAVAHVGLGVALHAKRQWDEAIAEYREAIGFKKDDVKAHNNLGAALNAKGQRDEAIAEFREAIRLKKDDAAAHSNLLGALHAKGQLDEAIAEFHETLRLEPDHAAIHFDLGSALQMRGKFDEAIAEYRAAVRLQPDDCNLHLKVGNIFRDQGRLEEAIAEYRAGLRAKPDGAGLHYLLGDSLMKQGKLEEAIGELRVALRLQPHFFMAHNDLAWLLATAVDTKWRKPAQAYEHAKKTVELVPQYGECWSTLGVAAYRNGGWNEAITALKNSEKLMAPSGHASNWLFLAMAHWQLGQQDEARQWYGKAAAWMKFNNVDDELTRFRAEADQLSGIADKPQAGKQDPKGPRPSRFPVVRFDVADKTPPKSGTPAVVVLDNTDPSFEIDKPHHNNGLRLLTSAGEQLWSHTGFSTDRQTGGNCIAIDRKRGRIYAGELLTDRITAFDLEGNKLWQIQQVKTQTLMVDDQTGNLWCSGGPRLNSGETIVFDDSGNEVAAYPCRAIDMVYDPHTDAFWLIGYQIVKVTRSGEVAFKEAVDGWCCSSASVNPKDGTIWIAESRHPDIARSRNCLWLRNADGSVRHKIDLGDTGIGRVGCVPTTGEALFCGSKGLHRASPDGKVSQLGTIIVMSISVSPSSGDIWITTQDAVIRIDDKGNEQAKTPFAFATRSFQSWIAAFQEFN